jgi:rubrerythrin
VSRWDRGVGESGLSRRRAYGRADLLRAGVPVAAGLLFGRAGSLLAARTATRDTTVLQLALRLEYTEAAFYAEALRRGSLHGELREYARAALRHEQDHVRFLRGVLGASATPKPSFDFGDATREANAFTRAAITLEDLAVAAYNGQAANVSPKVLAAAAKIVSVEARHAAWVRQIAGRVAAPDAVDKPATADEVERGLRALGVRP